VSASSYTTPEGTLVRARLWFDDGFTRVPNAWIRDKGMSFKARGILNFLLSHEPGFKVTIRSIAAQSTDGRDAVDTGVKELERRGYLRREAKKHGGRNLGTTWILQDPFAPQSTLPGLSTGGGKSATTPESYPQVADYPVPGNPVPKEDQLKKISKRVPEVTTERAKKPIWDRLECPGDWRGGQHVLNLKTGKCTGCHEAPMMWVDATTGELA